LETIYHSETGKYLFEEKEIHLVNSGRSFVDQKIYGNRSYTDKTAFIMGAPNFDYSYVADSTLLEDNVSFTYQTMRDLSLEGNRRVAPLPATHSEVEGINQTLTSTAWHTNLFTGNDALEKNLKQMESPRILHIATHGYFLEDVKPENDNGMRMMGMDVQRVAENPLLRSGLLLAGCNNTLADNTPLTGSENGILTAYEARLLDLSNTELVVLSACETGKGEIQNGEGVQGLRKAITDAGAEHILMSLWKVDDKVTSEYMQTFYGHYAHGKSIRESYNLTRNEIKQKYPQPYYWGAFVLVGE
jgi:CHAT domain-containing protein